MPANRTFRQRVSNEVATVWTPLVALTSIGLGVTEQRAMVLGGPQGYYSGTVNSRHAALA